MTTIIQHCSQNILLTSFKKILSECFDNIVNLYCHNIVKKTLLKHCLYCHNIVKILLSQCLKKSIVTTIIHDCIQNIILKF